MPIKINDVTYLTASEAAQYVGLKRGTFYNNVKPHLEVYEHASYHFPLYKQSDLERFKGATKKEGENAD